MKFALDIAEQSCELLSDFVYSFFEHNFLEASITVLVL